MAIFTCISIYTHVMPHLIETDRFELILIEANEMITLYEDPENLSLLKGKNFSNPHRVLVEESGPLRWRVPQVKEDPSLVIWLIRWIVDKATREIVGSISFHAKPDESGMIEIGLGIHPDFQNRGIGTEALMAMWRWVIDQPGVKTLRYTVSENNAPSIAVINKFEFENVGIQIDEEDGPETIFEMSAEAFREKFTIS
jgi:[ribosomal protein S5]-alanine N-acetyltransferase